jgi:SpoVK/Ycf46/Vps4 family AAA+-type ATPase
MPKISAHSGQFIDLGKNCFDLGFNLAFQIDANGLWPDQDEPEYAFASSAFYRAASEVISTFIKSDGETTVEEIALMKKLFGNDTAENIRWTTDYRENRDYLEWDIPRLIEISIEIDQIYGTSYAFLLSKVLVQLAEIVIAVDLESSLEETEDLTALRSTLMNAIEEAGLPLEVPGEDEEEEVQDVVVQAPKVLKQKTAKKASTKVAKSDKPSSAEKPKDLDALLQELGALVGLASVKAEVNSLVNFVRIRKMRLDQGMAVPPMSMHLVFTGNPGTGKTTVARLLAEIFASIGLLEKGHLVETARSGMVASYVGQTAEKVSTLVNSAKGGVLFIDEAYALVGKMAGDYGQEAIETLLKLMEDNRDELIVIVAGYTDLMSDFLDSNPGLKSRFNKFIDFPDYEPTELQEILEGMCHKGDYIMEAEALPVAFEMLKQHHQSRGANFGNGRMVRNFFEKTLSNQSDRLMASNSSKLDNDALRTLTLDDLPGEKID